MFLGELRPQTRVSVDTRRPASGRLGRDRRFVGGVERSRGVVFAALCPAGQPHLDAQSTLDALRPILEIRSIEKVGQNLKYDMIVLRAAGVAMAGLSFDTMVASYLFDAGQRNHNINDLAKRYLNHATIKIAELIGSGKHQKRMDEVPVEQVVDYAAEDAWLPLRLQPILARSACGRQTDRSAGQRRVAAGRSPRGDGIQRHSRGHGPAGGVEPPLRRTDEGD